MAVMAIKPYQGGTKPLCYMFMYGYKSTNTKICSAVTRHLRI